MQFRKTDNSLVGFKNKKTYRRYNCNSKNSLPHIFIINKNNLKVAEQVVGIKIGQDAYKKVQGEYRPLRGDSVF